MASVTRRMASKTLVFFHEDEIAQLRAHKALRQCGLPVDHWVQIDISASGILLNVYPAGVTGKALDILVKRARSVAKV